ncbi:MULTISPECIES: SOS response-associated peptidase [Afifella]|uniref:SOS response-associated peptidase n=1 Tax=Afifella TaxID=643217 RepID=UPI000FE39BBA|nr:MULTISPECIES: SOS response-associated peptidase [Afifella]MCT8267004.1 SOS response-associated peptidase [Afifella sp. JA880]
MCGRFVLAMPADVIKELFNLAVFDERLLPPRYNIAPTQPIVVIRQGFDGVEGVPMRWGFLPSWVKDTTRFPLLINARAEDIREKPAFRNAIRRRRCLVPASGFYEWQARGKGPKQPYWIAPKAAGPVAFAGIWETWIGTDGSEIDTAAIITVAAEAPLDEVHHRRPAMIAPENFALWLSGEETTDAALSILTDLGAEALHATPVSRRVNRVADDDAGLIEPVSEEEEAPPAKPVQQRLL